MTHTPSTSTTKTHVFAQPHKVTPLPGSRLGPGRQIVGKAPNASFRVGQTRPQAEEDPTSMSVLAQGLSV